MVPQYFYYKVPFVLVTRLIFVQCSESTMDNKRKQSLISSFFKSNEPGIGVKRAKEWKDLQEDNHDDASMAYHQQ